MEMDDFCGNNPDFRNWRETQIDNRRGWLPAQHQLPLFHGPAGLHEQGVSTRPECFHMPDRSVTTSIFDLTESYPLGESEVSGGGLVLTCDWIRQVLQSAANQKPPQTEERGCLATRPLPYQLVLIDTTPHMDEVPGKRRTWDAMCRRTGGRSEWHPGASV